jgi:hypothetical protein
VTGSLRPVVAIRTPLVARIVSGLMAVVGVVLIGGDLLVGGVRNSDWAATLFLSAFLVVWLTIVVRTALMAVLSTPDGRLLVRNQLRSRTLDRSEIEDVRRSAAGLLNGSFSGLQLLLTDGSVLALQASAPPFLGFRKRAVEQQQEQLRRWLHDT